MLTQEHIDYFKNLLKPGLDNSRAVIAQVEEYTSALEGLDETEQAKQLVAYLSTLAEYATFSEISQQLFTFIRDCYLFLQDRINETGIPVITLAQLYEASERITYSEDLDVAIMGVASELHAVNLGIALSHESMNGEIYLISNETGYSQSSAEMLNLVFDNQPDLFIYALLFSVFVATDRAIDEAGSAEG